MALLIDSKTVFQGWCKLAVAKFRLMNGQTIQREIEDHGQGAAVLPYDEQRRTALLVRQFRAAVFVSANHPSLLEAIAGIVDEADPADTVRREALEEAGLRLATLEFAGHVWPMPGLSTERISLYLAPYTTSDRVSAGGGEASEGEFIEVVELPLADLARSADSGEILDMKTLLLVQTLRLKRPDMFVG